VQPLTNEDTVTFFPPPFLVSCQLSVVFVNLVLVFEGWFCVISPVEIGGCECVVGRHRMACTLEHQQG